MSNLDIASYNRQGKLFYAANVSTKTVSAVGTAMTGVILHNPAGSGKKLLVVDAGFSYVTVPLAVAAIGLGMAAPNATAPSSLTAIGTGVMAADGSGAGVAAVGRAYDAATLAVAPTAAAWGFTYNYTSAASGNPATVYFQVDGGRLLVPGATICLIALTTASAGVGHISWVEVPA